MHHSAISPTAHTTLPPQKPIRFVTNSDGPYAKRRRINSACLTCRRRKTRCSGERPVCQTCLQNNHECGGYGNDGEGTQSSPTGGAPVDGFDGGRKQSAPGSSNLTKASPLQSPVPKPQKQKGDASAASSRRPTLETSVSGNSTAPLPRDGQGMAGPAGEEASTTSSGRPLLSLSTRNRMPYFRYFGPTAIMPGFKQMVVKVKSKQHGTGATSSDPQESPAGQNLSLGQQTPGGGPVEDLAHTDIPIYDTSAMSPSPLITHLCKTFFTHLGCNYPFLQQERFMNDLEEKQVDAILVDAVCALAARFSNHPVLTGKQKASEDKEKKGEHHDIPPAERGQAFAQRAKSAISDTFACPSVAVVQAALLLAYDEFGASRDSGLWMYLGIAIRMAQDLGMQTLEGLRFEGLSGDTPKALRFSGSGKKITTSPREAATKLSPDAPTDAKDIAEQRAVERERLDTFWAVFFLDRVVSSGTGRPVTLRDNDIDISFPPLEGLDPTTGWPMPFSALIRIIHLYGRVTDTLNSIKEASGMTQEITKKLAAMEQHLTDIYQGLSPRLHFTAVNFQYYVKAGQGTNFILLHFWFHTLIVLLHQPTLLKTFEGKMQQLMPNSRELSMSSAKTIADILAFAELIDATAALGNPFTSQPAYIAACAFLKEAAIHSASSNPHSQSATPPSRTPAKDKEADAALNSTLVTAQLLKNGLHGNGDKAATDEQKLAAKHTLLATAANQNYQCCYKMLQSLETYWAGAKYILTVLDQKAKGVGDPLLYTREEMESALELPRPEPSFTSPGWRRKLSWGTYLTAAQQAFDPIHGPSTPAARKKPLGQTLPMPASPRIDPAQAIGWSLTGTMNSPNTSLAVLYPNDTTQNGTRRGQEPNIAPIRSLNTASNNTSQYTGQHLPSMSSAFPPPTSFPATSSSQQLQSPSQMTSMLPPSRPSTSNFHTSTDPGLISDADLLLNLHSPFSAGASPRLPNGLPSFSSPPSVHQHQPPLGSQSVFPMHNHSLFGHTGSFDGSGAIPFGDMMIESQDIDMSALGDDMVPWLEYLPHDMLNFFDPASNAGFGQDPGQQPNTSSPGDMQHGQRPQ